MQLLSARFSHDGKWIAMHVRNSEFTRQIWAFPFFPDRETKQSEWVPITGGQQLDRDPEWSPDGKTIYFLADRDGFRGIYGQRVDGSIAVHSRQSLSDRIASARQGGTFSTGPARSTSTRRYRAA